MAKKKNVFRIKAWLLLAIILLGFQTGTARVFAIDEGFYSNNDILFYNPNTCVVGQGEGTSSLVGNDNLEKILRYYVGKGLTLVQASGIAGNFSRESSFNPAKIQGGAVAPDNYTLVNGTGFGLAQWTPVGRQNGLTDLSKSSNRKITDLTLQLDYSWQELNGGYASALTNIKQSIAPDNAAYVFHHYYEVSSDTEAMVKTNRGGDALQIYAKYKVLIPDGSTTSGGSCTGTGGSSNFVTNFTVYDQYDKTWANLPYGSGTIGEAGCGPSAMAMIVTALTNTKVTPADTATYGAAHGTAVNDPAGKTAGSYHNIHSVIGDHYGLTATHIGKDVAAANQGLRDGGMLILAGQGGAPFTSLGHFIAVRAVTANGKWLIADSNGKTGAENSTKEWDPNDVLSKVSDYVWLLKK